MAVEWKFQGAPNCCYNGVSQLIAQYNHKTANDIELIIFKFGLSHYLRLFIFTLMPNVTQWIFHTTTIYLARPHSGVQFSSYTLVNFLRGVDMKRTIKSPPYTCKQYQCISISQLINQSINETNSHINPRIYGGCRNTKLHFAICPLRACEVCV